MAGTLFVLATPIGNLEDLTPRVGRLLGEVELVLCEDTRHTGGLLRHLGVAPTCLSLHAHNERSRLQQVVELLADGRDVALVSDAGTPCLSDPGARVVAAAHDTGAAVYSVPGPFAAAVALAGSGLAAVPFTFWGFVAKRSAARRNDLSERLRAGPGGEVHALAFFVPGRDLKVFCEDVGAVAPAAMVVLARELTKIHEGYVRGTPEEVIALLTDEQLRGEAVVLVEVDREREARALQPEDPASLVAAALAAGEERKPALRRISKLTGLGRRELYKLWLRASEAGDD